MTANRIFTLVEPGQDGALIPVVLDSPHSGTEFPDGHGIIAPVDALHTCRDAWVDELWCAAPACGAPLLAARFPRAYVDPNRAPDDIDQAMLAAPWPAPLNPSAAGSRGMGLVRREALPGVPMYPGPLSLAAVRQRLDGYYHPYHAALASTLAAVRSRFGHVWHINCHSMKSVGNAMNADNGQARPDIVVSDCLGRSSNPDFTDFVATAFRGLGYQVKINDPYQGGYILERYGRPMEGCHSVQVEIRRDLYMNQANITKGAGYGRVQSDITTFLQQLARHATGAGRSR